VETDMIVLDHTVLRVSDQAKSVDFYRDVLGLVHEGRAGSFEIMRVNQGFTIDLVEQAPQERIHLAFCVDRRRLETVRRQLAALAIPHGGAPHARDGSPPGATFGARGMAMALYFDDPDGHILEIRSYDSA
jgi:glyoxylase I family protein